MSLIKIHDPMTHITNNTFTTSKSVEVTDLETHVIVCSLRYEALEGRLDRLEDKVNDIILQSATNNKLIVRSLLTVITGVVTSALIAYLKFS